MLLTRSARAKQAILKAAQKLQNVVLEVMTDVDDNTARGASDERPTRNTQALINDVAKTYSRLEEVRDATKQIELPLDHLLKLRNSAAHASTDRGNREVSGEDLRTMMDNLGVVLRCLSNCGTAIRTYQQLGAT